MRLRNRIKAPMRFEDDPNAYLNKTRKKKNGTEPAFPELLAQQVIHYNPNHPSAAFPSLPLTSQPVTSGHLRQQHPTVQAFRREGGIPFYESPVSLDISGLIDTDDDNNVVDFAFSNNIAAGDTQGVDPLDTSYESLPEEVVPWNSLELAYQYRIFRAICKTSDEQQAHKWLGIGEDELAVINKAITWREKHPVTLIQQHEGYTNWLEPRLLTKYTDFMLKISEYEMGSPLQLLRAGMFLQQHKLPLSLLGSWVEDPLGSEQLIESPPLVQFFPVGSLTPRQLQHVYLHGAQGLRPIVKARAPAVAQADQDPHVAQLEEQDDVCPQPVKQPQRRPYKRKTVGPFVSLKYRRPPPGTNPVGRPRKRQPLSTAVKNIGAVSQPDSVDVEGDPTATSQARAASAVSSEATSSSTEDPNVLLHRWTQSLPKSSLAAMPGRSRIGPPDSNLPIDPALLQVPSSISDSSRPVSESANSIAGSRTPRLKLRISAAGLASIRPSVTPVPPSSAASGKSLGHFATTPSAQDNTLSSRTTLAGPNLRLESTPNPIRMKFERPLRAEDDFKQSTRTVPFLETSSPSRFGDENNFSTRLTLGHRPVTPDTDDLGVFASAEDFPSSGVASTDQSGTSAPQLLYQARESAHDDYVENPEQESPLLGYSTPKVGDIVRSIEQDIDMIDAAPLQPEPVRSRPVQLPVVGESADLVRGRAASMRSPSPPRSISPISVNENFEEYQAWLRGETEHGPMPQTPRLLDMDQQVSLSTASTQVARASSVGIVKLKIAVTNDKLQEAARLNAMGSGFQDPGEDGDEDWEEPPFKKKRQTNKKAPAKKLSPRQKQATLNKAQKSSMEIQDTAATISALPRKGSKRSTTAESRAAGEASGTSTARSTASKTTPRFGVRIPPKERKQKRAASVEPRRSNRISSADVTENDAAQQPVVREKTVDVGLRPKLTPVSRLRRSETPVRAHTAEPAVGRREASITDSASDADSDAADGISSTGKARKKWTHKHYEKTRKSSRLADKDLPNMKV
jgi:hypothetical protein